MPASPAEKRAVLRQLHQQGCFVLPNPWDLGSLRRVERAGFAAVATTSAGLAWHLGVEDYQITLADVLAHLRQICAATDLPVNADFEGGFAEDDRDVAANVRAAAEAGVAALSLEDRDFTGGLLPAERAAARLGLARAALSGAHEAMLVGRCEAYLLGPAVLADVIARLRLYAAAGADCVYAPGITDLGDIATLVQAVAPTPVNVLLRRGHRVADLAAIGVRRVSAGGALAAAAWRGVDAALASLRDSGTLPP